MKRTLENRWLALGEQLNPPADQTTMSRWWHKLTAAYGEPHRHYHTLDHVSACLTELDQLDRAFAVPQAAEFALWFHDAVYVIGAADNEMRSADLAEQCARELGLGDGFVALVRDYIMITSYQNPPDNSPDSAYKIADIDLAILGQDAAVFDRYEEGIRAEYAQYPEAQYKSGRALFLVRMLAQAPIYHTPEFQDRYEAQARANLTRLIARLLA